MSSTGYGVRGRAIFLALLLALSACANEGGSDAAADVGAADSGRAGDATADAGFADSGRLSDAAPADTGSAEDAGFEDAGFEDAGSEDAGLEDGAVADVGFPDSGASPDASRAWSAPVQINAGAGGSAPGHPQVGIDSAGDAIAVWQEVTPGFVRNAVWASRYSAGGAWSTAATIDNAMGNALRPQLAVAPSGFAVAAFPQTTANSGGIQDLNVSTFDGAWAAPEIVDALNTANADNQRVALAPDRSATVVFGQPDGITSRVWANRASAAGVWGTAVIVDAQGPTSTPEVAVSANGDAVMTWVEQTGAFSRRLWASRNLGAGWSAPAELTPDTMSLLSSIRVVADANGNAVAVWSQQQASGRYAVRAVRLNAASGNWSAPVTLNDPARDAYTPHLGVDSGGDVIVVWHEVSSGVWFSRYDATAASWSGFAPVQPSGAPAGVFARVALNAAGEAFVVWLQSIPGAGTRQSVWVAPFDVASLRWGAPYQLMTDPNAYAGIGTDQEPVIAINASGEAVAVWYQRTDTPMAVGIWASVYR